MRAAPGSSMGEARHAAPGILFLAAATVLLGACSSGQEGAVVRGGLTDADSGCRDGEIRLVVAEDMLTVRRCRFSVRVDTETAELHFFHGDERAASMRIEGLDAGVRLHLHEVWFDENGRAFPTSVEVWGAPLVSINGLRVNGAGSRGEIDAAGEVLALASGRGTLLVRPEGDTVPDLYVRVDSVTEIVDTRGDPADLTRLSPGVHVRIAGAGERTHVRAERLVVPAPPPPPPPPPVFEPESRRPPVIRELERVWEELERAVTGRGNASDAERERRQLEDRLERERKKQEDEARRAREAMEREQRRLEERLERERRRRDGRGPPR
jgi:hypothetical protein